MRLILITKRHTWRIRFQSVLRVLWGTWLVVVHGLLVWLFLNV